VPRRCKRVVFDIRPAIWASACSVLRLRSPVHTPTPWARSMPRGYTATVDIYQHELELATQGHGDVLDLSTDVTSWLTSIRAVDGQLTVFVPGSTAAITTIEYEPGALRDLDEALEALAPADRSYHHDLRWGDGNGFSHLRAALLGPSLSVPVLAGACITGTWQQIVLVECDLKPRRRRVVFSFVGRTGSTT